MANTLVQFRIDEKQRKEAEGICEQLGFDLPSYLRMSVTRLVREKGVPFNLCVAEDKKDDSALWNAISELQASAKANGLSEMSLKEIDAEIAAARAERAADEDSPLLEAMRECSRIAEANGIADMTLEEIDAEIAAVRKEMRAEEASKNMAVAGQILRRAKTNGTADIPLEELNAEIAAGRAEKN